MPYCVIITDMGIAGVSRFDICSFALYLRCPSDMTWLSIMQHLDATCKNAGESHLLSLSCIKAYVQKVLHNISLVQRCSCFKVPVILRHNK